MHVLLGLQLLLYVLHEAAQLTAVAGALGARLGLGLDEEAILLDGFVGLATGLAGLAVGLGLLRGLLAVVGVVA